MTFLCLKMIIFGHFSRFLASFKIFILQLAAHTYILYYILSVLIIIKTVRLKRFCLPNVISVR